MDKIIYDQFFSLLRAGLWRKEPDIRLFENKQVNWKSLYILSSRQSVIGTVYDGIMLLDMRYHPDSEVLLRWHSSVLKIENTNKLMSFITHELFEEYQKRGLKPILLKGEGLAANYPNPERRQSGDVDIYFGKKDFYKANKIIIEIGGKANGANQYRHLEFVYKGIDVEHHLYPVTLNNQRSNKIFRRLTDIWFPDQAIEIQVGDYSVSTPPYSYNVLYLFLHMVYHIIKEGLGVKQICDLACFLKKYYYKVDNDRVNAPIKEFHLEELAGAIGYIMVKYLGMDADRVPFNIEGAETLGEELLLEILHTGNFGIYDERIKPRPKGYWRGRFYSYSRTVARSKSMAQFTRSESRWAPYAFFKRNLIAYIKKLTYKPGA